MELDILLHLLYIPTLSVTLVVCSKESLEQEASLTMKKGSTGCGGRDDLTTAAYIRKKDEGGHLVSDCDLVVDEVALICSCQVSCPETLRHSVS